MCENEKEKGLGAAQREGEGLAHTGTLWVIAEKQEEGEGRWIAFPATPETLADVREIAAIFGGKVFVAREMYPYFRAGGQSGGQTACRQSQQSLENQASNADRDADC